MLVFELKIYCCGITGSNIKFTVCVYCSNSVFLKERLGELRGRSQMSRKKTLNFGSPLGISSLDLNSYIVYNYGTLVT